jgi:hypothetical protein
VGYFPNGTSAEIFYERHCSKCHHDINQDCPVFAAHLVFNYDDCNKEHSILHMLIPHDCSECKMFIPRLGELKP